MRLAKYFVSVLIWATALTLACKAQDASLKEVGTTYARAQVSAWIAPQKFAVARWDGTLTIFRPPQTGEFGPILLEDSSVPSRQPIQMITSVSPSMFVTSNDSHSLTLWTLQAQLFAPTATLAYDTQYGTADSGAIVTSQGATWLVTGHEQGEILFWKIENGTVSFVRAISVRSSKPIPSPYQLWNVRGIVPWHDHFVLTGSEDGDIVLVSVPDGTIKQRIRYNPSAQRGINALAISGDLLLLANCSVGATDKNLWLYRVSNSSIDLLDSTNLDKAPGLPQVFDFSVSFARKDKTDYFLASTEEGLLWFGKISSDKLQTLTNSVVAPSGGAALSVDPPTLSVAAAAFDVRLFSVVDSATQAKPASH